MIYKSTFGTQSIEAKEKKRYGDYLISLFQGSQSHCVDSGVFLIITISPATSLTIFKKAMPQFKKFS